jgi:ribonuclease HI
MLDYVIYTDGAYSSSRDQGGIGIVVLRDGEKVFKYSKGFRKTTNNQMELIAVITALRAIKNSINSLIIYTDSMYVKGCATLGWKRKKNVELWMKFDEAMDKTKSLVKNPIQIEHVKGHADNIYNNLCDEIAVQASQELL